MRFPKAYQGVKKIFTAEILSLIGAVCALVAAIITAVIIVSIVNQSGSSVGYGIEGVGLIVLAIASGVLPVIGYIMKLVGMKQAGNDEPRFNQAFIIAIFALILTVLSSVFSSMNVGGGIADNIVNIFIKLADIFITVFIIGGIQNLAVRIGREDLVDLGSKLLMTIIIVYVLAILGNLVPVFFGQNDQSQAFVGILGIFVAILDIAAYIIFLVYLGKAKKALAEN